MGEYAIRKSDGASIKMGTCESMYYLRADQADLVEHEDGNVDPMKDAKEIRFRFPFPDEDHVMPGDFERHDKGVQIDDFDMPTTFDHYDS